MRIFETVASLREYIRVERGPARSLGFVPTMGAFHEGHLTLMRRAKAECDLTVVSLFVNPTQFAPGEDLGRYPRALDRDAALAHSAGVDALFVPSENEMYPEGPAVTVSVAELGECWEGARRPGHFDGVATVCARLFNIVSADNAYFGLKDYQQFTIINRLVHALHIPTRIVPIPTVRESDGLAMSSRNSYLSPEQRSAAPTIFRALTAAYLQYTEGEKSATAIEHTASVVLGTDPLIEPDYCAVVDSGTLKPLDCVDDRAVILVAARIGGVRLIDNVILDTRPSG